MIINNQIVNTYLWFAYLPPKEIPTWLDDCITPENKGVNYSIKEAASRFDTLFDKLLSQNAASKHIIPLSGGWDSRAILGALLERLDTSEIETVTFGVPGQLDYDIGIRVAKWAGVKHHSLDLRTVDFTWDKIIESVKKSPWTYVPDVLFNQYSIEKFKDQYNNIWSGFLGDAITGGHLSSLPLEPLIQQDAFIKAEKRCKRYNLTSENYNPQNRIILPNKNIKLYLDDA